MTGPASARPFRLGVPDATLSHIRDRGANYPCHEMPDDGGRAYGSNLDTMRALCEH